MMSKPVRLGGPGAQLAAADGAGGGERGAEPSDSGSAGRGAVGAEAPGRRALAAAALGPDLLQDAAQSLVDSMRAVLDCRPAHDPLLPPGVYYAPDGVLATVQQREAVAAALRGPPNLELMLRCAHRRPPRALP